MKLIGLLLGICILLIASPPVQAEKLENELFAAATQGKLSAVRQLVLEGAEVNKVNAQGRTAIMGAAFYGNIKVVQLLLAEGGDVSVADKLGVTVLMLAAHSGNRALIQLLVANGADVHAKSNSGQSAEAVAKIHGHGTVVALLKQLSGGKATDGAAQAKGKEKK